MKNSALRIILPLLLCLALVVSSGLFIWASCETRADVPDLSELFPKNDYYNATKLNNVIRMFEKFGIRDLPSKDELTDALIRAFVGSTGDRYAAYYDREEYADWNASVSGTSVGIGVTVTVNSNSTGAILLDVFPGSPAEAAGLLPGDVLIEADGTLFTAVGYETFVDLIRGEKGTDVSVTRLRGDDRATVRVTRDEVVRRTVLYHTVAAAPEVGYIRVTAFDGQTYSQFKAAVDALESAGVRGIVFDLRDNGGGTLRSVSEMLAYLLPDGDIAHIRYAKDAGKDYTVRCEDGVLYDEAETPFPDGTHALTVPLAVLVNANTASAAELFTAALRDYAEAGKMNVTVVGENTYGKGTVQTSFSYGDGTGYKLTVARYDPPFGENYDGVGIAPALTVERTDEPLRNLYLLPYEDDAQQIAAVGALTALWAD